ncbi:MAG: substrate-binding domain-containing protein [Oscillospiraceae bacterium]|nr:substrate-binding domain-containing protein [Oscillospiraceae bacterium]
MSRKAWLQLVLPLIGLSVLFWLLAFAPGEKHHQPPLLEMSVILRDGDGAVSTMRKGMEQAAQDLNVELRFLIPAEDNSAAQQAQLLEREVTGAASAVLLIPADREALGDAVSAAAGKTTLVTVETDMTAWGAAASITMDHQELGAALGAAALNGVPEGGTVLLLDSLPGDNGIRERMEAAKAVLEREGRQARVYKWDPDTTSLPDILRIERPRAIIAFEAAALADVAELSRGEDAFPLLYGCGSTASIAAALEKGRVTAITAVNVFSAGYLAVEAAAALARHEDWTAAAPVAFSIVRQETMYDSDNQKLLFPVT